MDTTGLPKFTPGMESLSAAGMNRIVDKVREHDEKLSSASSQRARYDIPIMRRAKLTGYSADGKGFKGRFVSAAGVTDPPGTDPDDEITFHMQRAPFTRSASACNPLLEDNFNSDDPDAWVFVVAAEYCDPDGDDDAPCGFAWYVIPPFFGAGCS